MARIRTDVYIPPSHLPHGPIPPGLASLVLSALAILACTDSELEGLKQVDRDGFLDTRDGDAVFDTDQPADTNPLLDTEPPDTSPPDTEPPDTEPPDTEAPDTSPPDTTPTKCGSDEECRALVGLGPCDLPVCHDDGSCGTTRREECCASDADCPAIGIPCVRNTCPEPGGVCVLVEECSCQTDEDCLSDNPCIIGDCGDDAACSFRPNPTCNGCQDDATCDDSSPCTTDFCSDGACIHDPLVGCCQSDDECFDNDPCTDEFCQPEGGLCLKETRPECLGCTPETCNDLDPCTLDLCTDEGCVHLPDPNDPECQVACQNNGDCDDGDACTRDRCREGACFYEQTCECTNDSDCRDGDFCTQDLCDGGQCVRFVDPTLPGCGCELGCDDGNRCTEDGCDDDGRCSNIPIPGCDACQGECDDGDPCTADRCQPETGECLNQPIPNCSRCGDGCDDGDICTFDFCREDLGECRHEAIEPCNPDGCQNDEQCADGSECTSDFCVAGECQRQPIPGCCADDADCDDGDACTEDNCFRGAGVCVNETFDCDDGNACTFDRCDPAVGCVSVPNPDSPDCRCVPELLWTRSFVAGEEPDIDTDGSGFGVRWRVDDLRAFSPEQSLRYGDEEGEDYDTGFRTFGRATGPPLAVAEAAGEVRLDFMVFMDIDPDPERDSLRARVLFGDQNLIVWDRVDVDDGLFGQWLPVSVALPDEVIGREIQVRFVFDSLDGEGNEGQGVFVDDIAVYTTCP